MTSVEFYTNKAAIVLGRAPSDIYEALAANIINSSYCEESLEEVAEMMRSKGACKAYSYQLELWFDGEPGFINSPVIDIE